METALIITHFYLPLLPMVANKQCPETCALGKSEKWLSSPCLHSGTKKPWLLLSMSQYLLSTNALYRPSLPRVQQISVRQLPHPPRTSWLLCIGHLYVRSLPCHCQEEAAWHSRNTSSFGVRFRLFYPLMAMWSWIGYSTTLNPFCLFVCLPREIEMHCTNRAVNIKWEENM